MAKLFDLSAVPYAHRGLWTRDGAPENSMAAFNAAAAAGYGMEFDVRESKDGELILFHDDTLTRMTHASGRVEDMSASDLSAIRLKDTAETIPTLDDLLAVWPHHLPLLVELKIDGRTNGADMARRVAARLATYPGTAAMMSFKTAAVAAFPSDVMRAHLIYPTRKVGAVAVDHRVQKALALGLDYLCCWHGDAARIAPVCAANGLGLGVYTCRSVADHRAVRAQSSDKTAIIFEHYDPALAEAV